MLLVEWRVLEVGSFCSNSPNVVYFIFFCKNYGDQYVGSSTDFKARFRIYKSDIKTKKDRCGTARHFLMLQ